MSFLHRRIFLTSTVKGVSDNHQFLRHPISVLSVHVADLSADDHVSCLLPQNSYCACPEEKSWCQKLAGPVDTGLFRVCLRLNGRGFGIRVHVTTGAAVLILVGTAEFPQVEVLAEVVRVALDVDLQLGVVIVLAAELASTAFPHGTILLTVFVSVLVAVDRVLHAEPLVDVPPVVVAEARLALPTASVVGARLFSVLPLDDGVVPPGVADVLKAGEPLPLVTVPVVDTGCERRLLHHLV